MTFTHLLRRPGEYDLLHNGTQIGEVWWLQELVPGQSLAMVRLIHGLNVELEPERSSWSWEQKGSAERFDLSHNRRPIGQIVWKRKPKRGFDHWCDRAISGLNVPEWRELGPIPCPAQLPRPYYVNDVA